MTSVIAHEINNPLESITNLLYLVRQDLPPGGDASAIRRAGRKRAGAHSRNYQANAALGTGEFRTGRKVHRGNRLSSRCCVSSSGKLRNRNVQRGSARGQTMIVDRRESSDRSGRWLPTWWPTRSMPPVVGGNVWIEAKRRERYCTVEIIVARRRCRHGAGCTQPACFNPSTTTKGDLGNGLGLYISNEIVERHRRATYGSRPKPGTMERLCTSFCPRMLRLHSFSNYAEVDLLLS